MNGATLTNDRFGNPNSAYTFLYNDNITVSNSAYLDIPAYTVSLWFNIHPGSTGFMDIFGKDGESSNRQMLMNVTPDRARAHAGFSNGNFGYFDSQSTLSQGVWYHMVQTFDGTTLKMYLNGVDETGALSFVSGGVTGSNEPIRIGGGAPAGQPQFYFNGEIDDIYVYNRVLSASEVQQLYSATPVPAPATWLLMALGLATLFGVRRRNTVY